MALFDALRLTAKRQQYAQLHQASNRGPNDHFNERVSIKDRREHRKSESNNGAGKGNRHGDVIVRDEREFLVRGCPCVYINKQQQQHDGGTEVFGKGGNGIDHKNP